MRQAILGIAAAAALLSSGAATSAEYYAGKTISLVVGYDPGGSTDATHRTYAPFLAKHIPGNPEVVIKNMPGAGGSIATNFVYEKAKPDGTTLLANPWDPIGALTGAPGLRADYTKFHFIGGGAEPRVTMVRSGAMPGGKNDRTLIVKAENLKLAGLRPTSNLDMVGRLSLELLGVNYTYVPGYTGAAKRRAALLSGEADIQTTGIPDYRVNMENAAVKEGTLFAAYYHPRIGGKGQVVGDPSITDIPHFVEFYKQVKGADPSGEQWELLKFIYSLTSSLSQCLFAPPGTPREAVEALRVGYAGLLKDKEFEAFATKRFGVPFSFLPTEEGQESINALGGTDPKLIESLKAFIKSGES